MGKGKYLSARSVSLLTSFKQTTFTKGRKYYFMLVALNNKGESRPSNEMEAMLGQ
jgi:hypothetical protein